MKKCWKKRLRECNTVALKTTYLNSNTGKYGPERTPYLDMFHAVVKTSENQMFSYIFRG